MYTCQQCNNTVPAGRRAIRLVLETRLVTHPARPDANAFMVDGRQRHRDDPGGVGTQIAREVLVCAGCAAAHTA